MNKNFASKIVAKLVKYQKTNKFKIKVTKNMIERKISDSKNTTSRTGKMLVFMNSERFEHSIV